MKTRIDFSNVIIIDGPRGSGKTTIANLVVNHLTNIGFEAEYYKKGLRNEENEFQNMAEHLYLFKSKNPKFIVVDRFVATEWVMSTFHRRVEDKKLFQWAEMIDTFLLIGKSTHIILMSSVDTLEKRMNSRNEDGRSWDMAKEAILPLWMASSAILSSSEVYHNEENSDIDEIARNIAILASSKKLGF